MIIQDIDKGKPFDWGKTSEDYAKYRDIYPQEFYDYILKLGLCKDNQKVLDIGTGTGVLPRNMFKYGAKWTGTDIAENQIRQAIELSKEAGMEIDFFTSRAEDVSFPENTFDVITACQCIWYFDHDITAQNFARMLKPDGKFLILYMGWLPYEDAIAGKSEEIILRHNPNWTAHGDTVHPVWVPEQYLNHFELLSQEQFRIDIPFTKEGWHGRMRACRGVGTSMSPEQLAAWDKEHMEMLEKEASERFLVKHYISIAELQVNKIETADLILAKASYTDWESLLRNIWSHEESAKYMLWNVTNTEEEAKARIIRTIEFEKNEKNAFIVYLKKTREAIGFATMRECEPGVYEEMGIAIGPAYVRRGYGKQILNALCTEAKKQGAKEFKASYREKNLASKGLLTSCGFEFDFKSEEKTDPRTGEKYFVINCKKLL